MARIFLAIYVALNLFVIVVNAVVNIFSDETVQFLGRDDWLIFIVACGALAICETLKDCGDKAREGLNGR